MEAVKTTTVLTNTPAETEIKGKAEKKIGKRIGYNYIILKSLKESQKNDVVKCLYIKSLTNFGFCVIKEGTYGDTKDKHGRDIKDRLVWQKQLHELLQGKVRLPKLLGFFEERGNYYLVMEHLRGKSLYKACYEKRKELHEALLKLNKLGSRYIDYLIQVVTILETLHRYRVVHRDATVNNFMIVPGGKVAIIDMELSYSLDQQYPSPPFQLGTYGYMSPQQEATLTPTIAEDIFSIGAIILQVWSGISPGKLTNEPVDVLSNKIKLLIPDTQIADVVIQCLDPNPEKRPSAITIREALLKYKNDLLKKITRPTYSPSVLSKQEIVTTIQQAIHTLSSPLFADSERGWFADDIKSLPSEKSKLNKTWYASYNRGVSGIIYMLSQAKKTGLDVEPAMPFVQKGLDLIKERYIDRIDVVSAGLHFGSHGIAAALAIAMKNDLITPTPDYLDWMAQLLQKEKESFGFRQGMAGMGVANIISSSFISSGDIHDRLRSYVDNILSHQERNGSWIQEKSTKKKILHAGFADGIAGITYFLLEYAHRFRHAESMKGATRALNWLMKEAIHQQQSIHWLRAKGKPMYYGWADGVGGVALTFMKAYSVTGDLRYKKYGTAALEGIYPSITDSSLGQLHGLSGLGEVYLEGYRVFNDTQWLERAGWISRLLMQLKKQHPEYGPYWLVEHERQPVANIMIGNSGILHFLLRYCYPSKIGFPLMPDQ